METEKILEKLRDMFLENGQEEVDFEQGILSMRLRGFGSIANTAEGEFSFLVSDESEYGFFDCRIEVLDEIREESLTLICAVMTDINAEIPLGGFAWDPVENTVFYYLRTPVLKTMSEEELMEEADSCVALSLGVAERYCPGLIKASEVIGG